MDSHRFSKDWRIKYVDLFGSFYGYAILVTHKFRSIGAVVEVILLNRSCGIFSVLDDKFRHVFGFAEFCSWPTCLHSIAVPLRIKKVTDVTIDLIIKFSVDSAVDQSWDIWVVVSGDRCFNNFGWVAVIKLEAEIRPSLERFYNNTDLNSIYRSEVDGDTRSIGSMRGIINSRQRFVGSSIKSVFNLEFLQVVASIAVLDLYWVESLCSCDWVTNAIAGYSSLWLPPAVGTVVVQLAVGVVFRINRTVDQRTNNWNWW
jgi:hypothetical protein